MSNSPSEFGKSALAGAGKERPRLADTIARAFVPQISSLFALAAALTIGIGLIMWASKPDYAPIYDKMSQQDAARVTEILRGQNIPYQLESGSLVTIPADRLDEVRMMLATEGISQSGDVGIEVLQQEQGLGTSRFIENARYQHALETELSRTISSMRNVETARVHLAMPKQSVFIRNQAKASASVMVKMLPGRSLENGQVTAIVNLVASSIPYLESSEVTIVDQWGRLLSSGSEGAGMMETSRQFEYARQLEGSYGRKIEALFTPILGPGRVRAEVNADVDFSIQESTQELFEPDEAQVRSEQSNEQITTGSGAPIGIPGALTNQPPAGGDVDPNQAGNANGNAAPRSETNAATRNYELDKTITHTKTATGKVQRLTVAVLVDNANTVNEAGETISSPLTEQEIQEYTALVKQSIGFSEARGDTVLVMNRPFMAPAVIEPVAEPSLLEQPWVWSMGKQLIAGLGVLLLIFWLIRPAMKNLKAAKPQSASPAEVAALAAQQEEAKKALTAENEGSVSEKKQADKTADKNQASLPPPPEVYGDILNMAKVLADEDPKRVATLIKNWVGETNNG